MAVRAPVIGAVMMASVALTVMLVKADSADVGLVGRL
jgi:hypothetical protein